MFRRKRRKVISKALPVRPKFKIHNFNNLYQLKTKMKLVTLLKKSSPKTMIKARYNPRVTRMNLKANSL